MHGTKADREVWLWPEQTLRHAWVPIQQIERGDDRRLSVGDVENKYRALVQMGGCQSTPAPVGRWKGERFVIDDGQHTYAALLMLGVPEMLVSWVDG